MIYTVTFNPAIDYVLHLTAPLAVGEINRTSDEACQFGGKPGWSAACSFPV